MRRMGKRDAFTDEELDNLKAGKCWCGKPRNEFVKGMRVYCTPEHRSVWYSKTASWQEFRNSFLARHGEKCDSCGRGRNEEERAKVEEEQAAFFDKIKPKLVDRIVAERLLRVEEQYENTFQRAIDTTSIDRWELQRYCEKHRIKFPRPRDVPIDYSIQFEVDHKIAIVNGGAEFDENNLQVLCVDCHRRKTKVDVRKAALHIPVNLEDTEPRARLEGFDTPEGGVE